MSFVLNVNSKWKNLPWEKILQRIKLIQSKIYLYSKKCNSQKVLEYQTLLFNCYEAKVYAIEYCLSYIFEHYSSDNSILYKLQDQYKFYFLQYLFKKYSSITGINHKISIFFHKIQQYIVDLCIQPEYKSKYNNMTETILLKSQDVASDFYLKQRYYTLLNKYDKIKFSKFIEIQYFSIRQSRKKHCVSYYINSFLYYWLGNQFFLDLFFIICATNINDSKLKRFNHSILTFCTKSIKWHNYIKNLKQFIIVKDYKEASIVFWRLQQEKRSKNSILLQNQFFESINLLIYKKFFSYYLLKKRNYSLEILVFQLIHKITLFYMNYNICKDLIHLIYSRLNYIIYYWSKKKYKRGILRHYFYKHNSFLNRSFYQKKYQSLYVIYLSIL